MQIKPTTEVLASWIESYVPKVDFYFLSKEHYQYYQKDMDYSGVLVMPIDEFYAHTTYGQIGYTNSYEYWNIKNANYVIIAQSDWIGQLTEENRQFILSAQVQCERGLVLPASFVENIDEIPASYIQNDHVVLQRAMWESLDRLTKEQLLLTMVYEWWDKGECEGIPSFMPSYLTPFANKFSTKQGANCLAAVLYAVTNGTQPWFIDEWVHQKTFVEKLKQSNYQVVDTIELLPRDVVVWQDDNDVIQHAAFHLQQNLFFNKHGQTYFNPWKLLSKEQLQREWGTLKQVVYRRLISECIES